MPVEIALDEPLDGIVGMLDKLTLAQEGKLREILYLRNLQRKVNYISRGGVAQDAVASISSFVDCLGTGEIDEYIKRGTQTVWHGFLSKTEAILETVKDGAMHDAPQNEKEPEDVFEQQYNDESNTLIRLRQALAESIAHEKALEVQINKNSEQIRVWSERVELAKQGRNEGMEAKAFDRKQHYTQVESELENQLKVQKASIDSLRAKVTELESTVSSINNQKQIYSAEKRRARAAKQADKFKEELFQKMKTYKSQETELQFKEIQKLLITAADAINGARASILLAEKSMEKSKD